MSLTVRNLAGQECVGNLLDIMSIIEIPLFLFLFDPLL